MKKPPSEQFESTKELRILFNDLFEKWQKKNYGGLDELAKRCGVSTQYLAQVRRYGRVPGKPVLILLAFNFDLNTPEDLFKAAGLREPWAYDEGIRLGKISKNETGFLSLRMDMDGFTDAIRTIVRSEIKPRGIQDLLGNRSLRIGLYSSYYWLYDKKPNENLKVPSGILPEFCRLLGLSLQREVHAEFLPFPEHVNALNQGTIDLYGPMLFTPRASGQALYTTSLHKCGISTLIRKKPHPDLELLPKPTTLKDLIEKPYRIAVLKNSLPHFIAITKLRKHDDDLILCDSDMEAVDRMLVRGSRKSAHIFVCNALIGREFLKDNPKDLEEIFNTSDSLLDMADIVFAVRPDFGEILPTLNNSMEFILERGGFRERILQQLSGNLAPLAGIRNK